ncbi:MAG: DNA-directed RNA polymerase subunit beta' [Rikenellaceae bacterium]|nr:DNA-directed RNA polymerase subunit beta' [Rikenellaceae bacterium]MBR3801218.1 DNA-directed RNA polymerase subunit beta' [Rikenellaceae bacterium]MBR4056308.1 DNA-directed RNA polymerase subunit beta' [Rikenellaceae bacterium]
MSFNKDNKSTSFNRITIGLASPEEILENSSGEVLKPETINYRTYKPERDGLFCERIFGPVKDYECHCGKYKRIRYKGIVCDRCGVEVTEKKVRRERMGHISLVVPVVHIWYFKSLPSKIGYLLGIPSKKLEAIIYYERYVVIQAGAAAEQGIEKLQTLAEKEYLDVLAALPKGNQQLDDSDPNKFIAQMGAEAIYTLLQQVDLDSMSYALRHKASTETSQQRKSEALKCLNVIEAFRASNGVNKPEWMVLKVIPVIPPELRPLVPLDGGRFATSDLNDLYRRVIIRNNRLKRLIEIKAPEVILRNEKRMLQEAVDSLFDNSRKSNAVKSESNRPLKSLSDSLKGKQGRFRQNLLGKRVDYSARSVIVVGPELKMHEMGIPKDMAAELYKPFVIRKLIERGVVKTVKSAKKIIDRKDPVIWDILENVIKGHPVLMNRAPTLHRLGIQAFQPKLIEGKAMQLHPLSCTAFNADFDGDQMAVHLPLGNAAILEAQMLMLGSHNVLNPANGAPITVPSQDMVLGLYYITKPKPGAKGEGLVFYGPEEAIIAYNEGRAELHAKVRCVVDDIDAEGNPIRDLKETTIGRIMFNQVVPKEVGYINELLTKRSLRDIIAVVMKKAGADKVANFLDDIKAMGYRMAFQGGLSFNLDAVIIPEEKAALVQKGYEMADDIAESYNMGLITNNERYNQVIDVWTKINNELTKAVTKTLTEDMDGFNPVYMMLDSGARGSKEQIRQLSGMRGLMAKPQKSGAEGGQVIENPILSNFKEGLSVLEYFISTHGARKGLADTALKTADAGYLTRRLVDVAQDVIINEEDCGTLRGLVATAIKKNEDVVQTLYERILGRVALNDVYHPITGELLCAAGQEITESIAEAIEKSPLEQVEIRSVLTCEARHGVCAKCYGRNLATARMVQKGEVVGVIAAQSIGEPGTQLTLRTFHVGGVAGGTTVETNVISKYEGRLEIDELRTVKTKNDKGEEVNVVISRQSEFRIVNPATDITLYTHALPYGATLFMQDGAEVKKGDLICEWDPYNAVIISEFEGKVAFENVIEGVTYRDESDEQTGLREKVVIESKDKNKNPIIKIVDKSGVEQKQYNLPVSAHIVVKENAKIKAGDILIKIPRVVGKAGDITGGLPRVTELFEARNPSNPAIVSEIDGEITFGKIKRGNREIVVTSKDGEVRKYLVPLSRQILVQENDYVKAGMALSDGAITPSDILRILGPTKVQEYIVNEVQDVYRMQGVKINDKHFEVIVSQMMNKVQIDDPGDTRFFENQVVDKWEFMEVNDELYDKVVVTDAGDSDEVQPGQIITVRRLRDLNSVLKRKDLKAVEVRDIVPATSSQILQGITRAALQTSSFMSAASFQETTKVLNEAAIMAKSDPLANLKENVICGHLIPAGTGMRDYDNMVVGSREEYEQMVASR